MPWTLKLRACGSEVHGPPKPRTSIAFDLRQEPGAGKPHAGICAGGAGVTRSPTATPGLAGAMITRHKPGNGATKCGFRPKSAGNEGSLPYKIAVLREAHQFAVFLTFLSSYITISIG
jgi:hypothetical protein